jgi:6-phosphogluconate dehydrogenase
MKAQQLENGMVCLGVMGRNLLLNLADHKHSATGYDKDGSNVAALRFGEVKVEIHGEQRVFEVQV